ncbi:MAG: hypothetical protein ACRCT2_11975, partial [Plesiomonas shigelloides]
MAALDITKLPTNIDRWEELHILSAVVLTELVGSLVIREAEPNQYSSGIVYAATMPLFNAWDQSLRVAPRVSLAMDPLVYTDTTKKFWKHVKTITEQAT